MGVEGVRYKTDFARHNKTKISALRCIAELDGPVYEKVISLEVLHPKFSNVPLM